MPVEVQIISIIMGSLAVGSSVWALAFFKIKKKELEIQGGTAELGPAVEALRDEIEQLVDVNDHTRVQLAEMQERLDFAERMLTAGRAKQGEQNV